MWTTIPASTIYRYYLSGVLGSRECYVLDCVQNTNDCYDVYSVVCRYWSFRYRTRDNTTSEAPKTLQDVSFDRHDKTKTQFTPYKVYNKRRRPFPIIVNFLYQQIISHVKILYDWWVGTLGVLVSLRQSLTSRTSHPLALSCVCALPIIWFYFVLKTMIVILNFLLFLTRCAIINY